MIFSQFDVGIKPYELIIQGDIGVSAEYYVAEKIGIENTIRINAFSGVADLEDVKSKGLFWMLTGKYFFNIFPNMETAPIYIGPYMRYRSRTLEETVDPFETFNQKVWTVGISQGQKFVIDDTFFFEYTTGIGRNVSIQESGDARLILFGASELHFLLTFTAGYRFETKKFKKPARGAKI